jgi:hypothetical protein
MTDADPLAARAQALQARAEGVPISITYEGHFVVRWTFRGGAKLAEGEYDVVAAFVAGFVRAWREHQRP